jgi:hypothetical protein
MVRLLRRPRGARVGELCEYFELRREEVQRHLERIAKRAESPIVALQGGRKRLATNLPSFSRFAKTVEDGEGERGRVSDGSGGENWLPGTDSNRRPTD